MDKIRERERERDYLEREQLYIYAINILRELLNGIKRD